MDKQTQIKKAEIFLELHHGGKLLVLPNIWDPLGARLLEGLGFRAVATASAAVAYSLGYDDGQKITFTAMLDVVRRIAGSVNVPVTADIERGYAENLTDLAENVRQVIRAGAVGVNIEDSFSEGGELREAGLQCERIQAVRKAANVTGVPLVINARIDVFMSRAASSHEEKLSEALLRAKAYLEAGADCIYPIVLGDLESLNLLRNETKSPINVYARKGIATMQELERIGISRLSLGPGLLKTSLTAMKKVANELLNYGSYKLFTEKVVSTDEILKYVSSQDMRDA